MKKEPEYNLESLVERANIYKEDGFTVNQFAVNETIGKVAVLRRHDKKNGTESRVLCQVEFYSTVDMPKMFFEKAVVIQETLVEGIAWISYDILACVCLDGSILTISPFSTFRKRHQISATPFWCVTSYSNNEIVAGTDSGNVFLIKYTLDNDENGEVVVNKQFSCGTDQRCLAIAASDIQGMVAVGCLDKVYIINANSADGKALTVQMQRERKRATIAWSLLFVGTNLFIGDSRGNVNVYNASNGALIKNITSHQAAVLALAYDGNIVYASGVDYRIQLIRQLQDKNDWNTIGQRIVHENDVRAMAFVDKWLLSGGAEHAFFISGNNSPNYRPIKTVDWSGSVGLNYQLLPSLFALTVVGRQKNSHGKVIPTKNVGVTSKTYAFEKSDMSPNGLFLVSSTCKALKVYSIKLGVTPQIGKIAQINSPGVVTAVAAADNAAYYAINDFEIYKIDYATKNETVMFRNNGKSSVRKLLLSPDGTFLAALTFRNEILFLETANNAMASDSKKYHQYTLKEPVIDFCWNDQRGVVILSTTRNPLKLLFLNGKIQSFPSFPLFVEAIKDKHLTEYPVAISSVVDRRIIIVSNLRNYTVLEFDVELKSLIKYECESTERSTTASDANNGGNESNSKTLRRNRLVTTSRLAPQWAFSEGEYEDVVGSTSALFGNQRIFLCSTESEAPPTQIPFAIKRFNRN